MRSAGEQPHSDYPRPRRHGGRLLGLALIVPLAIAPAPALAFELFGIHLFGEKADESVVDPVRYALSFDPGTDDDDELADALRDASIMLADEKRPVSGSLGLIAKVRDEREALVAAHYAMARYDGVVEIAIGGQTIDDIAPYAE